MSWTGVITDAGRALLEQWAAGSQTLNIDKAEVGSGTTPAASARAATALKSKKADAQIVSSRAVSGGTQIKLLIGPAATTAYTAKEVGLYGHLGSGNSVLLALHQDLDGSGVSIPTMEQSPNFAFVLQLLQAIGNEGALTVSVDPSAYVTTEALADAVEEMEAALSVPDGLEPSGPIILKAGVHYFNSTSELPEPGTPGRLAFVKV